MLDLNFKTSRKLVIHPGDYLLDLLYYLGADSVTGQNQNEWPVLETLEGIVRADGSEVGRGFGHDVLGGPLIALSWFANRAREGETVLRAGEIVTTGNLIRTQFPTAASRYQFDIKGLGSVTCEVMF